MPTHYGRNFFKTIGLTGGAISFGALLVTIQNPPTHPHMNLSHDSTVLGSSFVSPDDVGVGAVMDVSSLLYRVPCRVAV